MITNTKHIKDTKDNFSKEHKENKQENSQYVSDKKNSGDLNKKQVYDESHQANKTK